VTENRGLRRADERGDWLEWLIPGLPPQTHDGVALAPVAILLLTGLVAVVARWRRPVQAALDAPLPLVFACGLLTIFGYMMLGVPWFFWYAPAPMAAILLAVFLGLATSGVLRWAFAPLALFLVLMDDHRSGYGRYQTRRRSDRRHRPRSRDAHGRRATVMLEPVGIIGSLSGLGVIDEVGLVTPWVAEGRAKGSGWYARVIVHARPGHRVPAELARQGRGVGRRQRAVRRRRSGRRDRRLRVLPARGRRAAERGGPVVILRRRP
jgi:hypothetical protein